MGTEEGETSQPSLIPAPSFLAKCYTPFLGTPPSLCLQMPHCSRLPGIPPTHLHITHAEQSGQTQGGGSVLSLFISRWKIELWKEPTRKNIPTKQATKTKQLNQKPPLAILITNSSPGKKKNWNKSHGLNVGSIHTWHVFSPVNLGFWQVIYRRGTRESLITSKYENNDQNHV